MCAKESPEGFIFFARKVSSIPLVELCRYWIILCFVGVREINIWSSVTKIHNFKVFGFFEMTD